MPISSTQISGLVGGNQVAFANSAAYSQQLGSLYGTGPQISPPSMQNPFPSYGGGSGYAEAGVAGGGVIGGGAMALPALASGVSIAGGLAGGRAGWLDPFTAGYRAFSGGSGASAAGTGALTHIGRTFAQGGIRAGMGALGGGAAAAGAMALPYMAAGMGIQGAAESVYEGAQTYRDAGRIGQSFGPSFGQSGGLPGGKLPRHQIRQIATVLEEFADESVIASVTTATRLAQKFSQMGMMSGVHDAGSFKQKFQSLTKQVDTIAKVMGTSLEEAAPVLQSMQRMGLWKPEDVMGTLMTAKMVGPQAAQQMMGAMQTGAQQSHALGGSLAGGAALGREAFMTVQGGLRTGTFSNESISEYTGGVGGVEGQRMMAQTMTTAMQRAGRHPLYQAMMAGLGEMQEGKFTGRIDEEKLQEFMGGGMSAQDLMSQGRQRTRGRKAKLSFDYRRNQLSQEMVSKGGVGGMAAGLESVLSQRGDWEELGDEAKGRLIQMISGSDQRTAEMIRRVMEDHKKIQGDHERRAMDAVEDYYRERERRTNQSWQGFKDSITQKTEQAWRPFREVGADLSQAYDETRDSLMRGIHGVNRGVRVGAQDARTLALRGQAGGAAPAYTQQAGRMGGFDLGITGMLNYGTANRGELIRQEIGDSNLQAMDTDYGQILRAGAAGAAAGGVMGSLAPGVGTATGAVVGGVVGAGSAYLRGGAGTMTADGAVNLGRGDDGQIRAATMDQIETATRRSAIRARSSDAYTLGFQGENDGDNLKVVKSAMRQLSGTSEGREALRAIKKAGGGRGKQSKAIMDLLKSSSPEVRRAVTELASSKPGGRSEAEKDILRHAEGEVGLGPDQGVDWTEGVDGYAWANLGAEQFAKQEDEAADAAIAGLRAGGMGGDFIGNIAQGAAVGGLVGLAASPLGALAGAAVGGIAGAFADNISDDELRSVVTDPNLSIDLYKYLEGDEDAGRRLNQAYKDGNATVGKILATYDKNPDAKAQALEGMKGIAGAISFKAGERNAGERSTAAKQALGNLDRVRMNAADKDEFQSILKDIASGDQGSQGAAIERLGVLGTRMSQQGRGKQLERAGTFGQLALGMSDISKISDITTGEEGFAKMRKKLTKRFGGDIFEERQEDIDKMLEGGLDAGELQRLEEMATETGKQLSVRSGKGGKGGPLGELMGQLTTYTAANTKFVHTVAASVSGIDTGDLKAAADKLSEIMGGEGNNQTAKAPVK